MARDGTLREFRSVGQDLMALSLLTLHGGNLSLRRRGRVVITRTGARLDRLGAGDLVETPADNRRPAHPKASMELPVHLAIYTATGAAAIVHAHPPSAIALSCLTDRIVPRDSEGAILLGEVPVIRARRTVASAEVGAKAAALLGRHPVVVVAGHGSFAVGRSLEAALSLTTTLEMSAKVALWLRALGGRSRGRAGSGRGRR